jgi:RHS repeat-associated protein
VKKTISTISLVSENTTGAISWEISFTDIALLSTDGTVKPIFTRQTTAPAMTMSGSTGVTNRRYDIYHLSGRGQYPDTTTNYYHSDHLGSARLITSVNGYPVWQATYMPYGEEYQAQIGVNSYKFTGYEHDGESGLDYAKFRYYSSRWMRFMTPDPIMGDISNPQSWNRYTYVQNNPLSFIDPFGLCELAVTAKLEENGEVSFGLSCNVVGSPSSDEQTRSPSSY